MEIQQVLVKISNLEFEVFCPKIRQIEVRSAPLSYNVNKLSRVFSLFVTFSDFLLNSCLKLVGTLDFWRENSIFYALQESKMATTFRK